MNVTYDKQGRAIQWGKRSRAAVELTDKGGRKRKVDLRDVGQLSESDARNVMRAAMAGLGERACPRKQRAALRRLVHELDAHLEMLSAAAQPTPRATVVTLADRIQSARDALGLSDALAHRPPEYRRRGEAAGSFPRRSPSPPPRTPPRVEDPGVLAGRVDRARQAIFGTPSDESTKAKAAAVRASMRGAAR
jgi:hypothetical protein